MPLHNPQNPYRSFVVRASAGSGKTWQLSRRFLQLVAAGAQPGSILTVTFTRKAASEMRERIVSTAAQLLEDSKAREAFAADTQKFYEDARSMDPNRRLPPPRSAEATAKLILASSQSLRIATMDAIFMEWIQKFSFEASAGGALRIPSRFEMLSPSGEEKLHKKTWSSLLQKAQSEGHWRDWKSFLQPEFHLLDIENRLKELNRHESFLWLLEKQGLSACLEHPENSPTGDDAPGSFLAQIERELEALAQSLAADKIGPVLAAIKRRDLVSLQSLRILKADGSVHGGTFRGKKKDQLMVEIAAIDAAAYRDEAERKKRYLNKKARFLFALYRYFAAERSLQKEKSQLLSFGDLIKGSYHIFNEADAAGIRFLMHRSIHHLLLDEFQDTSILQWTVFRSIAIEMLAGRGLDPSDYLPPSVFIVGDAKQSIYGFREAEASILNQAAEELGQRSAAGVELSVSYRTSPLLLNFVNAVFAGQIADFPPHQAAIDPISGEPLLGGPAAITIAPLLQKSAELEDPITAEAQLIAEQLADWILSANPRQIFDKKTAQLRPLKAADCALLYRASTQASIYAEAFRAKGFAVRMEEGQSFFERLEIRDLLAFCRLMANPSDTLSFVELLKSPSVGITDALLIEVLRQFPGQDFMHSTQRHAAILAWLVAAQQPMAAELSELLRSRQELRPAILCQKWLDASEFAQTYELAFGQEEGLLARANSQRFAQILFELETQAIYDWYPLLDKLEQMATEQSVGLAEVSSDALQMMTIHKSKGLEWPLVILVGTGEAWGRTDPYWAKIKDHQLGSGVFYVGTQKDRPTVDSHMQSIDAQLEAESTAENFRLLYVALTRAQYYLLITAHQRKAESEHDLAFHRLLEQALLEFKPEQRLQSGLIVQELTSAGSIQTAATKLPEISQAESKSWQLNLPDYRPRAAVQTLAPAKVLSQDGTSTAEPFAAAFGSYVHKGLEMSLKQVDFDGGKFWLSLCRHEARDIFQAAWPRAQQKLDKILLSELWRELVQDQIMARAELPVAYLKDQFLVRGVIDLLLEKADGSLLLIDYKTITEITAEQNLRQVIEKKRYDQQLSLYREAVERMYPGRTIRSAILFTELPQLVELN